MHPVVFFLRSERRLKAGYGSVTNIALSRIEAIGHCQELG